MTHAGRVQRPAPTGSSFPTHLKRALALGARRVPGARSRPERPRALLGRRATPRRPPDSWAGFSPEAPGSIREFPGGICEPLGAAVDVRLQPFLSAMPTHLQYAVQGATPCTLHDAACRWPALALKDRAPRHARVCVYIYIVSYSGGVSGFRSSYVF